MKGLEMKRILHRTNTRRPLLSQKSAWTVISIVGLLLFSLLLHRQVHGPEPADNFRAQTQVQSNASTNSAKIPSASRSRSTPGTTSVNERTAPAGVAALAKHPENDESTLRRWQLGTHWGK